ncbi:MAG: hypothetical protein OSA23_11480 [Rhodospirillales bacterium]|nr:hypothetical protein [Rhodospirillales bacterium]
MGDPITVVKEMGLSHREFFRTIVSALGTDQFEKWDTRILLTTRDQTIEITLGVEGERRIALMVVPRTMVTLTFTSYTQAQADAVLKRFDMMFKRGGG